MRHLNTLIHGIAALIVALVFLIGVPTALVIYVGWPLPTSLPTIDEIQLALRSGINPQILINTLAVVVWITWTQLATVFGAETFAAVRGRASRRLPVLPGLQPAAAQLVAAITLAISALGPLRVAPAAATPLHAQPVAPAYTTLQLDNPANNIEPDNTPHQNAPADATQPTYRVGHFDTLWQIAETTLGDARRWHEIRDLNIGRTMPDGHRITETTDHIAPDWLLILPEDAQSSEESREGTVTEITVESGDSFWTIAEEALQTAWGRAPTDSETTDYWRQLVEVNQHRLQTPHDPDLIYPDQRFELPVIPTDPKSENVATSTDSHQAGDVIVEPGDNFWSIAHDNLSEELGRTPSGAETTDYWRQLVDTNRDQLLPPHEPDLIYPGQVVQLPASPDHLDVAAGAESDSTAVPDGPAHDAPTETLIRSEIATADIPTLPTEPPSDTGIPIDETGLTPISQSTETLPDTSDRGEVPDPAPATEAADEPEDRSLADELLPIASTLAGLGILTAGLVALLRRLRNTQLQHRQPGTTPTPPPPETVSTEATIRAAAAPTTTEFIDLALRCMAHNINTNHLPQPQVVGAHLSPEKLRLLLWTPHHNPPTPWSVDDNGRSWILPTDTNIKRLRHEAHAIPAPYPALVSVGHRDHTQLLLDLEYLGATQLTGNPYDVTATCYTMATELAASPIADDLQIICIGFGKDLAHLERVRTIDTIADIITTIEAKAAATSRHAAQSPPQARLTATGADTWAPIIVFDPSATAPEQANELLAAAHAGRGVAAVVGYPTGDRWRLHIDNDTIRIDPLGYTFARRNLTPTEQTAVAELIAAAKDLEGMPTEYATRPAFLKEPTEGAPIEKTVQPTGSDGDEPPISEPAASPAPEVRILGALQVDGLVTPFPLRRCTELVTYLTFHANGVEADTLMEAIWPDQPPDYPRLNRHTSRARKSLGIGPDGQPYLPYITDGIYRISPHLHSDLQQFTHHIQQAKQATGRVEADQLHAALELVQGTPFTGAGNAYTWAHTDGIITHTIVAIDNTAHRVADHALANNEPEQATWAARKGLLATGACEECYRNLMHAAHTEENQVALEAIYAELLAVTDADEGPDTTNHLDPKTIELYEQHTHKRRRQAG